MMSDENVELTRRGYAAFVRGDIEGILDILDPDVEMSDPFGFSTTDAYHGHDGFVQTVRDGLEAFERYEIETDEFIDAGDDVVVVGLRLSGRGKASGVEVDMPRWNLYRIRDGLAIRVELFETEAEALEAAGLGD